MSQYGGRFKDLRNQRKIGRGGRTAYYPYLVDNFQIQLKSAIKLLKEIAFSITAYQCDLPKKIGPDTNYRNLLRHLEILQNIDAIEIDHTERCSKRGKKRNVWRITFVGLLFILKDIIEDLKLNMFTDDDIWALNFSEEQIDRVKQGKRWKIYLEKEQELDTLSENYGNFFPLLFGKWDFFEKNGIKKKVIDHFSYINPLYFESQIKEVFFAKDCEETGHTYRIEKNSVQIQDQIKDEINNMIFCVYDPIHDPFNPLFNNIDVESEEKYFLKLCEDKELHSYLVTAIKKWRKELKSQYKLRLDGLDYLLKLSKPS